MKLAWLSSLWVGGGQGWRAWGADGMAAQPGGRSRCLWSPGLVLLGLGALGAEEVAITNAPEPMTPPLLTRWAAEISPSHVLPEYPRPQLVRPDWLNLNGLWEYAIAPQSVTNTPAFEGRILVPFVVESVLSGVARRLEADSVLWYRRRFSVPPEWAGRRVRLHFDAADWRTRVWLNGQELGLHQGGYDAFSFDITAHLRRTGEEELVVAVTDPTEGGQPRGKQARKGQGIFYTPASGIWQTVWLEPVPETCINSIRMVPDLTWVQLRVSANRLADSLNVEAIATALGAEVARVSGPANQDLRLYIPAPRLWTPDDPHLYDLTVRLKDGDRVVDTVTSYFGLRKVALRLDRGGIMRIALNDAFLFQVGTLDQGYWPDGIYTAPTDAALRYDVEFLKAAGFNLARKHVKVEPDRWYYWCDKLGLLVWQDMPSGENNTPEARLQFEAELQRMIEGRRNHPSVILWVLFNEGWGQYDTERLTRWLKDVDPSRLVDNASGWTDRRVGDVIDVHSYPGPESPPMDTSRAAVLGEFGGLGFGVSNHTWSAKFWGYQTFPNSNTLAARYQALLGRVWSLHDADGLSAAIYTQTTDVETECNGLLTYDRAVGKLDPAFLRQVNSGQNRPALTGFITPVAFQMRSVWRYTTRRPETNWFQVDYNASTWREGIAGFGTTRTPGAVVRTIWDTPDIWLRREFTLDQADFGKVKLLAHHDEDLEVYLNGVLAAVARGYIADYTEMDIRPEAAATLHRGVNVLGVHCTQNTGGQYVDVGIIAQPLDHEAR